MLASERLATHLVVGDVWLSTMRVVGLDMRLQVERACEGCDARSLVAKNSRKKDTKTYLWRTMAPVLALGVTGNVSVDVLRLDGSQRQRDGTHRGELR